MLHNLACDMGGGRELQTMMRERDLLINAEWQRNKIKNPVKQVTPLTCEGFVITSVSVVVSRTEKTSTPNCTSNLAISPARGVGLK